ncbi:MAG TPA: hypothetical protein ENF52_05600 [Chloroflexi bacterium]|nr:hypothetical protein [Chloroflexota bacterium]
MGVKEVQAVQDLLELERVKEKYARLERRGIPMSVREWYERKLAQMRAELRKVHSRRPIGQILLNMGAVDEEQLKQALAKQRAEGSRRLLGEILIELGWADEETIRRAVARQTILGRKRNGEKGGRLFACGPTRK